MYDNRRQRAAKLPRESESRLTADETRRHLTMTLRRTTTTRGYGTSFNIRHPCLRKLGSCWRASKKTTTFDDYLTTSCERVLPTTSFKTWQVALFNSFQNTLIKPLAAPCLTVQEFTEQESNYWVPIAVVTDSIVAIYFVLTIRKTELARLRHWRHAKNDEMSGWTFVPRQMYKK